MAKHTKIQKGLSDKDMFKGWVETAPAEEQMMEKQKKAEAVKKPAPRSAKEELYREYLTESLETQIGKLLLDVKMDYFKQGEGDFSVQVKRDGMNIILQTAPKKVK